MDTTTNGPSNATRARYEEVYIQAGEGEKLYDQFAFPASADKEKLTENSSVVLNFIADLDIATDTISEVSDINPKTLRDATVSVTPTSRGNAIQCSEKILNTAYTDYGEARHKIIGRNKTHSLEAVAMEAMLQGSLVDRAIARASLDAGTAAHRLSDAVFAKISARLQNMRVPKFIDDGQAAWMAVMGPSPYYDLRTSGNVVEVAKYQKMSILFNQEFGELDGFRLVVSPRAKIFGAAGADNTSAVATTLAANASALDTTVTVSADTNIAAGQTITIGTEETANTFYHNNEQVQVISISGTTVTIVGGGPNGGLMYSHKAGEGFRNADNVYPVAFGGPASIAKVYDTNVGEFGQVVGPKVEGTLDQFITLGWKWYGGYGRISESWLLRGEYASSLDA